MYLVFREIYLKFILSLFIGYLLGYYSKSLSKKISQPLISYGVPLLVAINLFGKELNKEIFSAIFLGISFIFLQLIIFYLYQIKKDFFDLNIFCSSVIGNTGYIGLPISILILPEEFVIHAIGFDIGSMLVTWGIIPILFNKLYANNNSPFVIKTILNIFFNSPGVRGIFLYFFINKLSDYKLLNNYFEILVTVISICALLYVGICIGELSSKYKYNFLIEKLNLTLILHKLIFSPLLMQFICLSLQIENNVSNAFTLQAAMPSAISILLLSDHYKINKRKVSSMIIITTFLSLISLPFIIFILKIS